VDTTPTYVKVGTDTESVSVTDLVPVTPSRDKVGVKKVIHTFGSHDSMELFVVPLMTLPIGKMVSRTAFDATKKIYYDCSQRFDLKIFHKLQSLLTLTKAAVVSMQYDQLTPLFEESVQLVEMANKDSFMALEGSANELFAEISSTVFLGIRDASLRNWDKRGSDRGHQLRSLAHKTFDIITTRDKELYPNANSILVLIVINFRTGHTKTAIELMETLYTKYNMPVPHNLILGSIRDRINNDSRDIDMGVYQKMEPVEWSELSPGAQKMIKNMILSFDKNDFNFLLNWAAVRSIVKNFYFGDD